MELHVYSQDAWHDPVYLAGDREVLERLVDCLTSVLETGNPGQFDSFTNDGEGFTVNVSLHSQEGMNSLKLPYHGEIAEDTCPDRKWPWKVKPSGKPSENPLYLEVSANVRYWEDGEVNGVEDSNGEMIPFAIGDSWCPIIRLSDGQVVKWPVGTTAKVYYKVCDEGEYWLRDENKRIYKYKGHYVPDKYLCKGSDGHGDYIILNIDAKGKIENWWEPSFNPDEWEPCAE